MKRTLVIATLTTAAVVCGGSAVAFADDDDRGQERTGKVTARATGDVTAVQAIDAALKAQPGTVVSADLDVDDDHAWEVDVLGKGTTSYTVHVDATTGKVITKATDDNRDDRDDDERRGLKGATVDAREAAEAASAKGFVTSVSLDDDDDDRRASHWDVETTGGGDWRVDLKTAKVTADDAANAADHDNDND